MILRLLACLIATCALAHAADPTRVACVGDSITFGAGVENRDEKCYPKVLGGLLGDTAVVKNFGRSGATLLRKGDLPYWDTDECRNALAFVPQVVVIMLGSNDSKPQNWAKKADFPADYAALIKRFADLPSKPRIWLCSAPPAYRGNFGITDPVVREEVNPLVAAVAKEHGLPLIDVYTALSDHPEMFPDQIHPNAAGAALLATTVHAALAAGKAEAGKQ